MWRTADYAKLAFGGIIFSLLMIATPVAAQDSQVIVQVCDDRAFGQLEIISPQSDTLLGESSVTLKFKSQLINQVDVYIDDNYHKVHAIPRGDVESSTAVSLTPGTQTIELRGVGVCKGDEVHDEIVVTYQPPVDPLTPSKPSPGSEVPTVVRPTPSTDLPSSGGVVVSNPSPAEADNDDGSTSQLGKLWEWLVGSGWGDDLFRTLDIDSTVKQLPSSWPQVSALVSGLALVSGSMFVSAGWRHLRWSMCVVGAILVLLALLVVV